MPKIIYALIGLVILTSFEAVAQLTNHVEIKPGFFFELLDSSGMPCDHFESGEMIDSLLTSTNQQGFYGKHLVHEQAYLFELLDAEGNKVPKTPLGNANSKPIDYNVAANGHGFGGKYLAANLFKPDDYFVITNAGIYTLEVQMRFWSEITNKQYGVVVTPPVRVQVEKK